MLQKTTGIACTVARTVCATEVSSPSQKFFFCLQPKDASEYAGVRGREEIPKATPQSGIYDTPVA
ncbi:hypothetical protein [Tannerella forsythia]|uniref:Uncharacterized protein n=1 Tax=Tannerella forsythia TaxID=28112 RepID=A0A3P1ZDN4_TANFO|nr:hypothetical protein [Tannerella forsythia]RRD79363.1 hypothetical protein EII41_00805 [Tannerella forsythia]